MTAAQVFLTATLPLIVSIFLAIGIGTHHIDVRISDLREFIRSEIKRLEQRIERLEHPVVIHQK